jgi:hypothetical protein
MGYLLPQINFKGDNQGTLGQNAMAGQEKYTHIHGIG